MNAGRRRLVSVGLVAGTIIAIGAVSAGPALAATTYTVDNASAACADNGPGTPSEPFCTIGAAAAKAVAGDTVLVSAGSYPGTSVNPANSGAGGKPITFTARRGVTILGGSRAFALSGRSDIVISGFTIRGTSQYGISVTGGSNVVISRNTISFAGQPVPGQAAAGIYLRDLDGGAVVSNVSHDNSSHGIYLLGSTTGVTVRGNRSYHNAYQFERNANGINVIAPGNTIVHNFTYANEDSGINVSPGANRAVIAGNVSYDNGDHGIDNLNVSGGVITGNTVFRNCTSGINVEGTSSHYVIENNIAMNNATGTIVIPTPINPPGSYSNSCNRRDGNIGVYDSAPATSKANFNLVWQSGTGAEYVWAGVDYWNRSRLHAVTGQEARGIFANPRFANPAAWNLQLTGHSPAIDSANSAAPGEPRMGILGIRRIDDRCVPNTGAGPRRYDDRGAYEFRPGRVCR
jgi:parallel beta-helix repeat protein